MCFCFSLFELLLLVESHVLQTKKETYLFAHIWCQFFDEVIFVVFYEIIIVIGVIYVISMWLVWFRHIKKMYIHIAFAFAFRMPLIDI